MIALLLAGSLMLALDVRPAWAIAETVYIKGDGSVVPSWAPISSLDNVTYTFTGNISYPAYYGIIVERNNIVIDGNGYTVQGDQSGIGLNLTSINNVTIKDVKLESFSYSIRLEYSSNNSIVRNSMTNSVEGIHLQDSSSNLIYHNNFANNTVQVYSHNSTNIWDDGYPSGGNYWSDYNGTDLFSGPYQNVTGNDGIGDTPYTIDANNKDRFPYMIQIKGPYIPGDLNHDGKVDIRDLAVAARAFGSYPSHPRWNPLCDINHDGKVDIRDLALIAKNFGKKWT